MSMLEVNKDNGVCDIIAIEFYFYYLCFISVIPATFRYNTRCMSKALDITEMCETHVQELDNGANIDEGVDMMER